MDINRDNYQQYFLREVDGELSGEELAALRQFLQAHPVLRQELALLQDTKLPAEEIPFPDKTSLYHRQAASGQLRPLPRRIYRRVALAVACVAAALVFAVYLWGTKSPVGSPTVIQPSIAVRPDTPAAHREKKPRPTPQRVITRAAGKPVSLPIRQAPPPVPRKPEAPPVPVSTAALTPLAPLPTVHSAQRVEPQVALVTPVVPQPGQQGETPESGEGGIIGTAAALVAAKDGLDEVITEKVSNAHRSTRDWVEHLAKKGVTIGNLTIALKN